MFPVGAMLQCAWRSRRCTATHLRPSSDTCMLQPKATHTHTHTHTHTYTHTCMHACMPWAKAKIHEHFRAMRREQGWLRETSTGPTSGMLYRLSPTRLRMCVMPVAHCPSTRRNSVSAISSPRLRGGKERIGVQPRASAGRAPRRGEGRKR